MKTFKRGVVSFPKCGRTWIRLFLEYCRQLDGLRGKLVVFRHEDEFEFIKRVLLVRHPCDVMVSFYLHEKYRRKYPYDLDRFIGSETQGIPAYNRAYEGWSEYEGDQIVVCYEDLFELDTWHLMFDYLDIRVSDSIMEKAFELTKFSNIRSNLHEIKNFRSAWRYLAAENGLYDVVDPKYNDCHKFRRGVVGGYVDYMDKEAISFVLNSFSLGTNLSPIKTRYLEMSGVLSGV